MKTLKTFAVALGATVLATAGLYAQSGVVADIPFAFSVQNVTMPAGQYHLRALSSTSEAIQIRNAETGKSAIVLAPKSGSTQVKDTKTGKVIFHHYGDQYFFSEVWTPDDLRGCALPSKLEKEYRARNAEKQVASVSIPVTVAP